MDTQLRRFARDELRRGGFTTEAVSEDSLLTTLSAISKSGGRVDAVALVCGDVPGYRASIALNLAKQVRQLDDHLTFRGGVRTRTVPIAIVDSFLAVHEDSGQENIVYPENAMHETKGLPPWIGWLRNPSANWCSSMVEIVQEWRQSLINELDYVGFAVSFDDAGRMAIAHALQRRRREGEILADEATPGTLKESQYLILAEDFLENVSVYTQLRWLLENYLQIAEREKIKPETVFQRFFEQNPHLVKRGLFEKIWAKPALRRPEAPGKSYAPDFVLKPSVGAHLGTNWEILDLKLPDDPLLISGGFHPAYSTKLTRAMQQLRNYRNYFSRQDHDTRNELVARFGYQPVHPRIAVLIGRRRREEGLDRVQGDAGDLDIDIITYDDVVEFEQNRLVIQGTVAGLFSN